MKLGAHFGGLTILSLAGCSMLSSAGPPTASAVVASAQSEDQILFDVVPVDQRVVSTLLAQPKESFHARFENDVDPPELKIAIGDTISVTIWESAAGGLFTRAPCTAGYGSAPGDRAACAGIPTDSARNPGTGTRNSERAEFAFRSVFRRS